MSRYAKFIAAIVGQALTYLQLHYGANPYVTMGVAAAMALGVYAVPNAGKGSDISLQVPPVHLLPGFPELTEKIRRSASPGEEGHHED
jgi:hypothetical protein